MEEVSHLHYMGITLLNDYVSALRRACWSQEAEREAWEQRAVECQQKLERVLERMFEEREEL